MKEKVAIIWFRQDLRLNDNPALTKAAKHEKILPIYILDHVNAGRYAMGGASQWWLHHSLNELNYSLNDTLSIYTGNPQNIINDLLHRYDVEAIYWNRCYEPWRIKQDKKLKKTLKSKLIKVQTYNGSLLWEPWKINKEDGTPYRVFTPFYRKGCLNARPPRKPLTRPNDISFVCDKAQRVDLDTLNLLPAKDWDKKLDCHWQIGELAAENRLKEFIRDGLHSYKRGRDIPSKPYVSRLSPYLHFGQISPNIVWYSIRNTGKNEHVDHYCSELGWREFSYNLLYNNPELPYKGLQTKFDRFPWKNNFEHLRAWQRGLTGIPSVDAGMRELWQTGYMHNRMRMIVGSYLTKNLRLHWHHGERWFWNTLADADLANNSASWQWIAGCGADAAPYFRIFNPVTQGQRFDPDGDYIRQYVPEIAKLPNKCLFAPWETQSFVLKEAGVELGKTYPYPIVDLKQSRNDALLAFQTLKSVSS